MQSPHAHQMDVLEISVHYERSLKTVELHTCGETFRLVTQGLPKVPGNTIVERCAWLEQNADRYRRALMLEPRGHKDLYGGYLTEPVSAGADFGVIFLNNAGYSPHCGHGVIALATAAVELGWVERTSPRRASASTQRAASSRPLSNGMGRGPERYASSTLRHSCSSRT